MKKLSKTQQELLDSMMAGVRVISCHDMGYPGETSYYIRSDTNTLCTSAANALIKKELVDKIRISSRQHLLRIKN